MKLTTSAHRRLAALVLVFATSILQGCKPDEEAILFSRSFEYELTGPDDGFRGSMFEWSGDQVSCAAGFVYSIQSRVYSNTNDLEFWCRDKNAPAVSDFKPLPAPPHWQPQTRIANINGTLYDFDSRMTFSFESSEWKTTLQDRTPYTIQRIGNETVTTGALQGCPGLSIWFGDRYSGTIATTDDYSAIHVTADEVLVNKDHAVWRGRLHNSSEACAAIDLDLVVDDNDWVYGFFRMKDRFVFGGSTAGYDSDGSCPDFYSADEKVTKIKAILKSGPCAGGKIKEFYSFTPTKGGALVGTYPVGTILKVRGDKLLPTDIATPSEDDFLDKKGTRYRESQSVVSTAGRVFVGMYPWGEIIENRGESINTHHRLFSSPKKQANTPAPFFWDAYAIARTTPNVRADSGTETVFSLRYEDGDLIRPDGLEPISWAQRVPTIAVFSGLLCASTGNATQTPPDKEKHPYLNESVLEQYGRVYCADLANHTMTSAPVKLRGEVKFTVTKNTISIDIDGDRVASNHHQLSKSDLDDLKKHGRMILGKGSYGKFRGTIKPAEVQ